MDTFVEDNKSLRMGALSAAFFALLFLCSIAHSSVGLIVNGSDPSILPLDIKSNDPIEITLSEPNSGKICYDLTMVTTDGLFSYKDSDSCTSSETSVHIQTADIDKFDSIIFKFLYEPGVAVIQLITNLPLTIDEQTVPEGTVIYQLILFELTDIEQVVVFGVDYSCLSCEPPAQEEFVSLSDSFESMESVSNESMTLSMESQQFEHIAFANAAECPDLDEDNFVNLKDFALFSHNWFKTGGGLDGDFDEDGTVDLDDLAHMTTYWLNEVCAVVYVDGSVGTSGDGSSWGSPYKYLQDALDNAQAGDQIWVAEGTYYPDEDMDSGHSNNERTETFQLVEGVEIYGGFDPDGGADEWLQRDPLGNTTTLCGDIDDNNGTNDSGNSYRVVNGAGGSLIDGFTVTGGYSLDLSSYTAAGLYTDDYMDIANCRFCQNYANSLAGGIFADNTSITISNCLIHNNQGTYGSGVLISFDSPDSTCPVNITNCTISNNYELNSAGPYSLGAFYIYNSSNTNVKNCILWDNILYDAVGDDYYYDMDIVADESSPIMSYTDYGYQDNISPVNIINCISSEPLFAYAAGGDFHLRSTVGRWDGTTPWTTDTETSPCINSGDHSIICDEPTPNGDRINMGAYGNTDQSSISDLYPFIMKMVTSDSAALPTDAKWNILGDSVNMTELDSSDVAMVPAGSYTISFDCNNSTSYIPPDDQHKTVSSSSVNYYIATYQACGLLEVTAECPDGMGYLGSNYGRWTYNGGSTWNLSYDQTSLYAKVLPGTYTIEFAAYDYLTEPSDIIDLSVAASEHLYGTFRHYVTIVYVDPITGSDTNVGTEQNPVDTVTYAATQVASIYDGGEILIVRPETTFFHSDSGTTRGIIREDVTLFNYVKIRYLGSDPFVHITANTTHSIYVTPLTSGIIFD